jgi:hypothetical protein
MSKPAVVMGRLVECVGCWRVESIGPFVTYDAHRSARASRDAQNQFMDSVTGEAVEEIYPLKSLKK